MTGEVFAPSFGQQRLWFLDRLDPGSPLYNVPAELRLSGPFDPGLLRRAVDVVVGRHAALRTVFDERDGGPVQVVLPELAAPVRVVETDAIQARRLIEAEALAGFDLQAGPLFRVLVLRLAADDHYLMITMHHIVSDGWSLGVLLDELAACYTAFATGTPLELPELPSQYSDFSRWQHDEVAGPIGAMELEYWAEQLRGAPAVLTLPAAKPRPAVQSHRGAVYSFELSAELTAGLHALSRSLDGTLFMTLLAGYQAVLARYSGQDDVVVGTALAGRSTVDSERLIGFFVNTVALRTSLAGNPSFRELADRVRDVTLEALGHSEVPFERVVSELSPERSQGHSPVFQAELNLQSVDPHRLELPGIRASRFDPVPTGTAKFDLTLAVAERDGLLAADLEYNTDLFEPDQIERFTRRLRAFLTAVVADPDLRIGEVPLLSEAERDQTVALGVQGSSLPARCVHDLVAAWAARTPERVAVESETARLSYAELDRRSNQLAWALRERGVGPEVPVAVCLDRGVEVSVALLGILKAGGYFVPLDPDHPAERTEYVLDDTGASILVADAEDQYSWQARLHTVVLDSRLRDYPETAPEVAVSPENLAYVMYTSGSTGTPKGVQIPHRGIVRLVHRANFADLDEHQVLLQLAPLAFDASTLELWGALCNGATLAVYPPEVPTAAGLEAAVRRHGVTVLWLTAGLFHHIVETQPSALAGVRHVLAGGDVLSPAHVRVMVEQGVQVSNGYGPTECTTFSAVRRGITLEETDSAIAFGTAITNTDLHVVDAELGLAPSEVPGELLIGGPGLARGYLGKPALTAERFVPDPFGPPGARLYRTGDLVHRDPDGTLRFLGRGDHQVKIRGHRIEPGEIETALQAHPAVRAVSVGAHDSVIGEKQLVAHVVLDPVCEPDELREFLSRRLPSYLVPTAWVTLDELPLTHNGKVDRKALPAPDSVGAEVVGPRTVVERAMVALWTEVLGLDQLSVHDDFFALGGHSLLAARLLGRVREYFQLQVPLRALFDTRTVASFSAGLSDHEPNPGHVVEVAELREEIANMPDDEVVALLDGPEYEVSGLDVPEVLRDGVRR